MRHAPTSSSLASKRTRLTSLQFYSHQLMRRAHGALLPHVSGRLFQQYCVDAYCKAEGQRLHWCRNNQDKLRAEEYQVLQDWVTTQRADVGDQRNIPKVGRPIIFPSSFGGGARSMQMNYQDALAIVRECGKPDFFITMTANPAWPEVASNLAPGAMQSTGRMW